MSTFRENRPVSTFLTYYHILMYIVLIYFKTYILLLGTWHFVEQLHFVWPVCIRVYFRYHEQQRAIALNVNNARVMKM